MMIKMCWLYVCTRTFKDSVSRFLLSPPLTATAFWANHLLLPHMDFDNDVLFNFLNLA